MVAVLLPLASVVVAITFFRYGLSAFSLKTISLLLRLLSTIFSSVAIALLDFRDALLFKIGAMLTVCVDSSLEIIELPLVSLLMIFT